jgi:hypothetical protein
MDTHGCTRVVWRHEWLLVTRYGGGIRGDRGHHHALGHRPVPPSRELCAGSERAQPLCRPSVCAWTASCHCSSRPGLCQTAVQLGAPASVPGPLGIVVLAWTGLAVHPRTSARGVPRVTGSLGRAVATTYWTGGSRCDALPSSLRHIALGRARVTAGGAPSCHGGRHHRVHQAPTARPHDDAMPAPAPVPCAREASPPSAGRGETRGVTLSLRTGRWCCLWPLRQYGKSGSARWRHANVFPRLGCGPHRPR